MDGNAWELRSATKGRPYRIALPGDLRLDQLEFIRSHLPTTWTLARHGEKIGPSVEPEIDYEYTRKLATDRAELEMQVLNLIEQKRTLALEIRKMDKFLAARKKRAKSFASTLNEVLAGLDITIPEGVDNG